MQDTKNTTAIATRWYFAKRNFVPPKSFNQKKKQKDRVMVTSEGAWEYIDEDEHELFQSFTESELEAKVEEPKPSLKLGDYIQRKPIEIDSNKEVLSSDTIPTSKSLQIASLSWPYVPKITENPESFYGNFIQPLEWPSMIDYQDYSGSEKSPKSSSGLVDLDVSDPCLPRRPCLLCRMSYGRNSGIVPCYEQRQRWNVFDLCLTKVLFDMSSNSLYL